MKQTTISKRNNFIGFWLFVALATFVVTTLSSCSTRKVIIDEVKKDSISQITTKIATKEDIKIENDITIDEFTITPLDTCKDIVIDGKTYRNVVLSYKKTKDKTVQNIKVSQEKLKVQDVRVTKKEKVKSIDRTSYNAFWLLLIPLALWSFYEFKIR